MIESSSSYRLELTLKPRLVLHIGTYKTGSTAIQSFLRHNDAALRDQGFLYPLLPGDRQSHTFLRAATAKALKSIDATELTSCISTLAEQINFYSPEVVILSSEHFWPAPPRIVALMISSFEHLFGDISVTIYLRPQRDLWISLYSQFAKQMQVLPSHSLWGTPEYCGKGISDHGMYYVNVLDGYRQASDAVGICARIYNRSLFPNQDVVSDFADSCKLNNDMLGIPSNISSNESLAWKAVEFSKALATHLCGDHSRRKRVAGVMRKGFMDARKQGLNDWIGNSPNYLTESEQDAIHDHYEASNHRLSAGYFNSAPIFEMNRYLPVNLCSIHDIPSDEKRLLADLMMARLDDADMRRAFKHLGVLAS